MSVGLAGKTLGSFIIHFTSGRGVAKTLPAGWNRRFPGCSRGRKKRTEPMNHPLFFTPITDLAGAKTLLRYLDKRGLTYHCEDDVDPVEFLSRAGQFAFTAWRNAGPERDCIAKWIPEIIRSRGNYGQCRPQACRAWAERMVREHERERVATLYQHGAIGHDSYESGTRNIEDGNVHLIEA